MGKELQLWILQFLGNQLAENPPNHFQKFPNLNPKRIEKDFLTQFQLDRMHDQAPLNAILAEKEIKKQLKKYLCKGD